MSVSAEDDLKRFRSLSVALLMILYTLSPRLLARACDCVPMPRCGAPKQNGPMFLGDVLSSRLLKAGAVIGSYRLDVPMYSYKIRVVETFSGRPLMGQELEVLSGTGGADCSFHFVTGQRYLVDTWEVEGTLSTSVCLLTRPERIAQVELETLRRLGAGRKVPDVIGDVGQYFPGHPSNPFSDLDKLSFPAVPGIGVELRPVRGGQAVTARTDTAGVFRMERVEPGQYKIEFDLPKGLVNANPSWDAEAMLLTVPNSSKTGPMCRVGLEVGASGSVSGRVMQRRGKVRVDERVQLYSIGSDGRLATLVNKVWPEDDGSFQLGFLGAGRYRLLYHVRGRKDVVYPRELELAEGERKTGVEFRLP